MRAVKWWEESRFILWIYSTYCFILEGLRKVWDKASFFLKSKA